MAETSSTINLAATNSFLGSFGMYFVYFLVIVVVLILVRYYYMSRNAKSLNEPMLFEKPLRSKIPKPFSGNLLPLSSNGMEWSYSFWIFVKDWNFNYGRPKCVMYRGTGDPNEYSVAAPAIYLYPRDAKMSIRVSTMKSDDVYDENIYPTLNSDNRNYSIVNPSKNPTELYFKDSIACDISAIPLQKWVHVAVSLLNGNVLDVYMNGKSVRSCQLPGVVVQTPSLLSALHVGAGDTYNGYISRLKYYNRAITSNEVYNLYTRGPYPSSQWWDTFKNQMKLTLQIDK